MEVLINAGGKGTRMGACGIEKPMQIIGDRPVIQRVVDAMNGASGVDRVLVSVSHNTPETETFLKGYGVETIRTTGEDFMMDIHDSFSVLNGDYVLMCPSDIPLISSSVVDKVIDAFRPEMQSMIVTIEAELVRSMGVTPSFAMEKNGREWVLSGVSVMDRKATLEGKYLDEEYLFTDWKELAVNVNTPGELSLARQLFRSL